MNTKQVIVFRKDLLKGQNAIRKGKFAAQVAHASLSSLLTLFSKYKCNSFTHGCDENLNIDDQNIYQYHCEFTENSVLNDWLNGKFTKVVVCVNNDEELKALAAALDKTEIPHALITDCGATEFHGVATNTCLGIGPYISEKIDEYTGHLSLL